MNYSWTWSSFFFMNYSWTWPSFYSINYSWTLFAPWIILVFDFCFVNCSCTWPSKWIIYVRLSWWTHCWNRFNNLYQNINRVNRHHSSYRPMWSISCDFFCLSYKKGPSWSWSYGSWIYSYLCNQCISPLTLWIRTPLISRCTRCNIMWSSLSITCDRSVVLSGYSGFLHQ